MPSGASGPGTVTPATRGSLGEGGNPCEESARRSLRRRASTLGRYVTRDGRVAVVKDTRNPAGAPSWFFMAADCLERLPVYIGRRTAPGPAFPFVPFGNRLVEPTTLETYKDLIIVRTRWNRWTGLRADGTGTARMNTCEPSCANGRIVRRAGARISVSQPRRGFCFGRPASSTRGRAFFGLRGSGSASAVELVSGCGNS